MSGGGKSQTSTQQVQIPPEVMARYNAVNKRAEATASKPFQQYSQDPNAFVAPLTATQQAGIQNVNQAAGMSQPYFNTAAGLTMAGSQGVGPLTQQQIGYYQNPFTQSVVNSTMAGLQQQQGQQLSQQQAEAIKGGAFGGDRAGIQRAQLMGQQGLATAQAIAPLYQQGYQQAVQTAQGQQGVVASDLQRQLAAGQQLGGLGAAGQQAALAGAQAQIGAGTAEQQTQQAGLQALYNQFLQERGYDFQTAQFLANIAMGTGALSGSTTTTTQPAPFFSDEREKTNVQPLGEGMYAYDYIDDVRRAEDEGRPMPPKRVGPMAQDIEERAPGLVGEVGGHKVVDASGGLGRMGYQSMGGMVSGPGAYAAGGSVVGSDDMRAILAAIGQPLEFYGGKGLYGGAAKGGAGSPGYVPQGQIATPKLVTAGGMPQQQPSGLSQAAKTGSDIAGLLKTGKEGLVGSEGVGGKKGSRGLIGSEGSLNQKGWLSSGLGGGSTPSANAGVGAPVSLASAPPADIEGVRDVAMDTDQLGSLFAARGGLMRRHYDLGGSLPYATDEQGKDPLQDIGEDDNQKYEMLKPTPPPSGSGGGSALGDIANIAKTAASIFAMSDERMKDNIEAVGELYDGQPIYRYNMKGSPQTQLGLMAQDVERNGHSDAVAGLGGVKMVDYKRATDVAAGLAGRQGLADGGVPYEDLPAPGAIEVARRDPSEFAETINSAAKQYGVDPRILRALIQRESSFDPDAVGSVGEIGLGQIKPSTARDPGYGVRPVSVDDLRKPEVNIPFAAEYLSKKARHLGHDPNSMEALMAYNAGSGAREYAQRVMNTAGLGGANLPARASETNPERPTGVAGGERFEGSRSPSRQGLSARPGVLSETPENAPIKQLFGSLFGDSMSPDTKKALTSENLWVPALAGIGSMLASRSPYLASAVGEGLQGGTAAYTALQNQQAEIEAKKAGIENLGAQTIETEQRTLQSSLQTLPNGMAIVWTADGKPVPLGDYQDLKNAGRAPPLLGRVPRNADEILSRELPSANRPVLPTGSPPDARQPPEPPKAPGTTEPAAPKPADAKEPAAPSTEPPKTTSIMPSGVYFDDKSQQAAKDERNTILNGGPGAQTLQAASKDYVDKVLASGTAARDTSRFLTELTENLASAAQGKGVNVAGFGFNGRAEIINALNTFSRALGGPQFGAADEIKQINEKISALQAAAATKSVGQESYAALALMKNAIANPAMTPRAFAQLSGDLLAQNQRMIDRYNHYEAYTKASTVGAGKAQSDFSRLHNDAKYTNEAKAISNMVLRAPDLIKAFRSGQYPANEVDKAFKDAYGLEGMSRYFMGGR
jgi:hypothetical protein